MTEVPGRFVRSLRDLLTTVATYGGGHPKRRRVEERMYERMTALLDDDDAPAFTFDAEGVRYHGEPVDSEFVPWGRRLRQAGVEHLELRPGVERQEVGAFVDDLAARLNVFTLDAGEAEFNVSENIRFGPEAAYERGDETQEGREDRGSRLEKEVELFRWIREQARRRKQVPSDPVRAIVRSLWTSMRRDRACLHMIRREGIETYDTTHALNVATLSMGMGLYSDFSTRAILRLGEAALVHDIGKVTIPARILEKGGDLSDAEWRIVRRHPRTGAQMLLQSAADFDLAAVVAFEHHATADGGYPPQRHAGGLHAATRLVQICDVYDAFASQRSFRGPWPRERILDYLRGRAGSHFDPGYVSSFCRMIEEWNHRLVQLDPDEPARSEPSGDGGREPAAV